MADTEEATVTFVKGQKVTFLGYETLAEGQEELLQKGETVTVHEIKEDGSLVVYSERKDEDDNLIGDQAFPEEVEAIAEETTAEAAAPAKKVRRKAGAAKAEGKATTAKTTAKKGKASTKAEPETAAAETQTRAVNVPDSNIIVITDAESVTSILEESDDAVAAAKTLINQGERTDYTLGGVLHHIYSEGIFKAVTNEKTGKAYEGKRGFADFVEKELGIQYRKAIYLISIYTVFRQLNIDEDKLQQIGWSKAKELARIAKLTDEDGNNIGLKKLEDDFDELAEFAGENTRDELVAKIQSDYIDGSTSASTGTRVNRTRYKFVLVGEAANVADAAMKEALSRVEGDNDQAKQNAAFELILGEWGMLNADMSLEDVIAMVQNKFDVQLRVVEGDADGVDAPEVADQIVQSAAQPAAT